MEVIVPFIFYFKDTVIHAIVAKLNGAFTEARCDALCNNVVHTLVPGFVGTIAAKGCEVTHICHK